MLQMIILETKCQTSLNGNESVQFPRIVHSTQNKEGEKS